MHAMSVLDRRYRRWQGAATGYARRMLVIPRYAVRDVFRRKVVLVFYMACLFPPLLLGILVYLSANLAPLRQAVPLLREFPDLAVTPEHYGIFWGISVVPVVILTLIAGPPLISADLANNALPLYFSKALTRADYIIGKALVLVVLLSGVSWLPLIIVYALQWSLMGPGWREEHSWLAGTIFIPSVVLIAVLTAVVMAISAHVRRTRLAQVAFCGIMFLTTAAAGSVAESIDSRRPEVVSPILMLDRINEWAFLERDPAQADLVSLRSSSRRKPPVSVAAAFLALGCWVGASVVVVARRIRPVEVVT